MSNRDTHESDSMPNQIGPQRIDAVCDIPSRAETIDTERDYPLITDAGRTVPRPYRLLSAVH